jgi:Pentapeptide repeats (8 copies).
MTQDVTIPNSADISPADIHPDANLSDADLTNADLSGANLSDADLSSVSRIIRFDLQSATGVPRGWHHHRSL